MAAGRKEDASGADACDERLLFIFFLIVIFFFFLWEVAVFGNFLFLVLIVIIVFIGNDVQMDGMDLRDFQLGLALRATENLAFFDLILVDVDFGGTFWAADHGSILRKRF
jgi:ABC-type multidrug transport system fused ATPase/permease subunit